ncbi:S9 family peptidase [Rheinheimera salexigens]|uniref:Acyl-peptide hydrolase n=1 Tax=Rheinheimera salexigens TaxID=1628148 RepID=A0A1E7Q403_9GAMM|nr:S9 family peptidase [Rheinheimera salexigens]OEY68869.1 acyl-peptide hydrolase [Rheinheimera salexigens]
MRFATLSALAIATSLLCVSFPSLADAKTSPASSQYFEAEDIFALEYASDPQISPNGQHIVYVRNSNDIMTDSTRNSLWLINVKTGQQVPLFVDQYNYSQPRWSADGNRLAFISDRTGSRQIHLHWLAENKTALLSQLPKSPGNLTWSTDGKQLAFTMSVPSTAAKVQQQVKKVAKPKGAKWSAEPIVLDRARYQSDGSGFLKPEFRQIFLLSATGGTARQLTQGDFHYGSDLSFSPDSQSLIFSANLDPEWEFQPRDANLYQLNLATEQLTALTTMPGVENSAVFSPNGKKLAFLWQRNEKVPYSNTKLKVLNLKDNSIQDVAVDFDRAITQPAWLDNNSFVVQYDERGQRKLATLKLNGKLKTLTSRLGGVSQPQPYLSGAYSVSANGIVTYTHGTTQRPADVAVINKGKTTVLTALNEDLLGHKKLAQTHEIIYKSAFDGEEIQGWYMTPPDFDPSKKYPLLLEIHGGPHLAYGAQWTAEMQRYAKEGYVVFYDNHRGSSSYGERFALLLQNKYSSPEDYADHDSGVNAMIELGFIDADNLFIGGGSAGGIASAYAIGLTNRYKAAAVVKPIINWLSKVLTGDSYLYQTYFQFPGVPWENVEHYWQRSPLSLVGNVQTPTILITGEEDRRTPISESEQFYQALQLRGIDTALVRIPGSPHGISNKPSRMINKVEYMLAWFEMYRTNKE